MILQNSARLLFSMLISQGVEKSDTVLYKNFYALVQEVKIPMDIKSVCNSSFVNTFNMERILPFLDYIAEDEEGRATFYAYYLQKAVQEAEFDLAETLLSHVGEKQEEYVVLTKETSALFAEAVAFLVVSQGDEGKECFSLFKKIRLQPIDTERVLAQFIGLAVNQNDQEWVEEMITLLPEKITWGVLAYNLACYFASISEKEKLLHAVRQSIALDRSAQQFMDDSDFDAWVDDKDFMEALKGEKENAEADYLYLTKPFTYTTESKRNAQSKEQENENSSSEA